MWQTVEKKRRSESEWARYDRSQANIAAMRERPRSAGKHGEHIIMHRNTPEHGNQYRPVGNTDHEKDHATKLGYKQHGTDTYPDAKSAIRTSLDLDANRPEQKANDTREKLQHKIDKFSKTQQGGGPYRGFKDSKPEDYHKPDPYEAKSKPKAAEVTNQPRKPRRQRAGFIAFNKG